MGAVPETPQVPEQRLHVLAGEGLQLLFAERGSEGESVGVLRLPFAVIAAVSSHWALVADLGLLRVIGIEVARLHDFRLI
jgi:hypothetical protein